MAIKFGMTVADMIRQLTRGFRSVAGRDPDGLEKIKIQQEAVQRFKEMNKVVDMEGKPIDTSKGIMGGKQIQDSPEFGEKVRRIYDKAKGPGKGKEMVDALGSPGARRSYEIMEAQLGVRLYGDETFDEILEIQRTGKPPRGEPPMTDLDRGIKQAYDKAVKEGILDLENVRLKDGRKIKSEEDFREYIDELNEDSNFAEGGRIGYKLGSIDKARRAFLKTMGAVGAGIGAVKSGILGLGEKAAPMVEAARETVTQAPSYFFDLVAKIKMLGKPGISISERQNVTNYKNYELTEDVTTGDIRITKQKGDPDGPGYKEEVMEYNKGGVPDEDVGMTRESYDEATLFPDMDGKMKDIEDGIEPDSIQEIIEETIKEAPSIKKAGGGIARMLGE